MKRCPQCDREMDHQDDEPDVNVRGGWICYECNKFIPDDEEDTLEW